MGGMRRRHELRETLTQLKARKAMNWVVCSAKWFSMVSH